MHAARHPPHILHLHIVIGDTIIPQINLQRNLTFLAFLHLANFGHIPYGHTLYAIMLNSFEIWLTWPSNWWPLKIRRLAWPTFINVTNCSKSQCAPSLFCWAVMVERNKISNLLPSLQSFGSRPQKVRDPSEVLRSIARTPPIVMSGTAAYHQCILK